MGRLFGYFSIITLILALTCAYTPVDNMAYAATSIEQQIDQAERDIVKNTQKMKAAKTQKERDFYAKKLKYKKDLLTKLQKQSGGTKNTASSKTSSNSKTSSLSKASGDEQKKINQLRRDIAKNGQLLKTAKTQKERDYYSKKLAYKQNLLNNLMKQTGANTQTAKPSYAPADNTKLQTSLSSLAQLAADAAKKFDQKSMSLTNRVTSTMCVCGVYNNNDLVCRQTDSNGNTKTILNADPPAKHWGRIPSHCIKPDDPCVKQQRYAGQGDYETIYRTKYTNKNCSSSAQKNQGITTYYFKNDSNGRVMSKQATTAKNRGTSNLANYSGEVFSEPVKSKAGTSYLGLDLSKPADKAKFEAAAREVVSGLSAKEKQKMEQGMADLFTASFVAETMKSNPTKQQELNAINHMEKALTNLQSSLFSADMNAEIWDRASGCKCKEAIKKEMERVFAPMTPKAAQNLERIVKENYSNTPDERDDRFDHGDHGYGTGSGVNGGMPVGPNSPNY